MNFAWSLLALNPKFRAEVLIVGTDPVLSPLVALVWRAFRPKTRLVHWCFDLYPEAAIADGLFRENSLPVRILKSLLRKAYRSFDLIVDIGSCMRQRLLEYGPGTTLETIAPWALVETSGPAPIAVDERRKLFGDATLALLYSGSFGRAHFGGVVPELARALRKSGGQVAFSVGGSGVEAFRKAVDKSETPIIFADLVPSDLLQPRLSAADVHIVSLRDEWTGTVVPSKFFAALAVGRPVLFVGSNDSEIARLIRECGVGWVLDPERIEPLAAELMAWVGCQETKELLFQRCHSVYQDRFSKRMALDRWDDALRSLIEPTEKQNELELAATGSR